MIKRLYNLETLIQPQKVLVIYGPRRSGKTTLVKDFLSQTKLKYKFDSGDSIKLQHILSSQDFEQIIGYAAGYELIVIDEAQQISNIGMGLKILVDQVPNLSIIATGSSSFDLAQKIGEPLTGRKRTIILYPFPQKELLSLYNKFELKENLENFLIFGSYPEVVTASARQDKIRKLEELTEAYLLKDILTLEQVKGSKVILDLLKLLSFQVGSEVSLNELATQLSLSVQTVDRYLDLLEKNFVIKRIYGFSRNLRKEIRSKCKYYFFDNGIRNAVIMQFNPLADRNDVGLLFENFMVMERFKINAYLPRYCSTYFWRTYSGQEIDFVEERDGKLFGYEFKWNKKKVSVPKDWKTAYANSEFEVIDKENYLDFIL